MQVVVLLAVILCLCSSAAAVTRFYRFTLQTRTITRNCITKSILTVNRQYPGPTIYANDGDRVIINTINTSPYNITIHWHGIRQIYSCWADGPAYVTQCPIQPGSSYIYNFTITNQTGSMFWHSHHRLFRDTVYGAIVVGLKPGLIYPFGLPEAEYTIILGEWWNDPIQDVEILASTTGRGPQIADAYTLNGQPGPLYNCSKNNAYQMIVLPGKTYLLRLINAALDTELFFAVANHNLTVVQTDGDMTQPYTTSSVFLAPGQSLNVQLTTNQPLGSYYMGASPYSSSSIVPFRQKPTLGIVRYIGASLFPSPPILPSFPSFSNTEYVTKFNENLKSTSEVVQAQPVPQTSDSNFFITIGLGIRPCEQNEVCSGPFGAKLTAEMNNVSFVLPAVSVLQAYYYNIPGVYTSDFPATPLNVYNYTGTPPSNITPLRGTRTAVIPFNASVQIILQSTSILTSENHPIHLHGYSFYVVGEGFGNFNISAADSFNLVDPPRRNTVAVPVGGWSAIRFWADNPGVWYMHCHLEAHTVWGLATTFTVLNGPGNQVLPPPPPDLPQC